MKIKFGFTLAEVRGMFPRPIGERTEFQKLNFPSPAAFFSRRGSGCMRSMSITTTGEVRKRGKKVSRAYEKDGHAIALSNLCFYHYEKGNMPPPRT